MIRSLLVLFLTLAPLQAAADPAPAAAAVDRALATCDTAERLMPKITRAAEVIAVRHMAGGQIGFPIATQSLAPELTGRSGGMINMGYARTWKKLRSDAERAKDVGLVSFDRAPNPDDAATLKKYRARGVYLVGIGSGSNPAIANLRPLCDVWLDTGNVSGRDATLSNVVVGWSLTAEIVGAMTRHGKMPPMFKGYAYADGPDWAKLYLGKLQFDDAHPVSPQPAGQLGKAWLNQIRSALHQIADKELPQLTAAGDQVAREVAAGHKVIIAWQGHLPPRYIGQFGDSWAVAAECHAFLPSQVEHYAKTTPDGALVISLGTAGLPPTAVTLWNAKHQRVIHLCGDHPDAAWRHYNALAGHVDLHFAFGDACVALPGYPIRLFAPSGVLQLAAYDAIVGEAEAQRPGVTPTTRP
jgi:hypothetical protein